MTSIAIIFNFSLAVHAKDPYLDIGSKTGKIDIQSYNNKYNDIWVTIIDNGIANWNDSSANVSISVSSKSSNTIEAARYDDSWYGLTTQRNNIFTGYSFEIQVNARTISADATNTSNFATSTVTHEFGHIFWLCDNPDTGEDSIMKYNRDRNTMTKPQSFDIDNVNAKY